MFNFSSPQKKKQPQKRGKSYLSGTPQSEVKNATTVRPRSFYFPPAQQEPNYGNQQFGSYGGDILCQNLQGTYISQPWYHQEEDSSRHHDHPAPHQPYFPTMMNPTLGINSSLHPSSSYKDNNPQFIETGADGRPVPFYPQPSRVVTPTNYDNIEFNEETSAEGNRRMKDKYHEVETGIDFCDENTIEFLNENGYYKVDEKDHASSAKLNEKGWNFVSKNCEINLKCHINRWRKNSTILTGIQTKLTKKKATFTGLARRMLCFAAIQTPKTSQQNASNVMHLSRVATLLNLCVIDDESLDVEAICLNSAKENCVGNYILDLASELTLHERAKLLDDKNSVAFLGIDKGPSGDFVKIVSQYNHKTQKVEIFILDNEKSGGTNVEAAHSIKFSVDRFELGDDFTFGGFTADSGGGGTRAGLMYYLKPMHIVEEDGLIGTCSLHCLQLLLANPTLKYIGKGGIEERNALQLLHAIFDLQENLGVDQWRKILEHVQEASGLQWTNTTRGVGNEVNFKEKLCAPVLSRWWTVGVAARLIVNNLDLLKKVTLHCIQMQRKDRDRATALIASRLYSLFHEETIVSDLKLIHCFNNSFLSKHFKWLQGGDERVGGTPGFYGRNMLVRYFLLYQDLQQFENDGWKGNDKMSLFYDTFKDGIENTSSTPNEDGEIDNGDEDEDEEEDDEINGAYDVIDLTNKLDLDGNIGCVLAADGDEGEEASRLGSIKMKPLCPTLQQVKARKFFRKAMQLLHKHFQRYANEHLFLGLFGETPTASIVAKKILHPRDNCATEVGEGTRIQCSFQGCSFDLKDFAAFLDEFVDPDAISDCPHLNRKIGMARVRLISTGNSIWDHDAADHFAEIRKFYICNYSAWLTSTHCVEAGVKKSKDTRNGHRTEQRMAHYILGSNLRSAANHLAIERRKKLGRYGRGEDHKGKVQSRGSDLLVAETEMIIEFSNEMDEILNDEENVEVFKRIRASLNDHRGGFKKKRIRKDLTEWIARAATRQNLKGTKEAHASGFYIPDECLNRFPFNDIRKGLHQNLLGNELAHRGIQLNGITNFSTLKRLLKEHEVKKRFKMNDTDFDKMIASKTQKQKVFETVTAFIPRAAEVEAWSLATTPD